MTLRASLYKDYTMLLPLPTPDKERPRGERSIESNWDLLTD